MSMLISAVLATANIVMTPNSPSGKAGRAGLDHLQQRGLALAELRRPGTSAIAEIDTST